MRTLILIPLLFVTLACSHSPSGGDREQFTLKATSNRMLQLEPCGCVLKNLGGIDAELLLHQTWRGPKNSLYVTSGVTFVPRPDEFNPKKLDYYRLKAKFVAEAMEKVGVNVVGLSSADLLLGLETLKKVGEDADFQLISTNIVDSSGKAPFPRFLKRTIGGNPFVVLALSEEPKEKAYKTPKGFQLEDPIASAKKVLSEMKGDPALIVLSSGSKDFNQRLLTEIPAIRFLIGGRLGESYPGISQVGANTLVLNPEEEGKMINFIGVNPVGGMKQMFSEEAAKSAKAAHQAYGKDKGAVAAKLKKARGKTKTRLEKQMASIRSEMQALEPIFAIPTKATSSYFWHTVPVRRQEPPPKNELTELIERMKEAVRQHAIRASRS